MKNKELLKEIVEKYRNDLDNGVFSKELKAELTGNGKEGLLKDFLYTIEKAEVSMNYDELVNALKERPMLIYEIEEPTEEMIQAVLNSGKTLADMVNHPNEKLVRRVLRKDPYVFRHIKNPSKELVNDYLLNIKNHDDYDHLARRMLDNLYK